MMKYMSGKSYHPKNQENQRKVWVAEQREKERGQKEKDKQRLLQQERNKESLFTSGTSKDPKHSQVGFMYQPPPGFTAVMEKEKEQAEEDRSKVCGVHSSVLYCSFHVACRCLSCLCLLSLSSLSLSIYLSISLSLSLSRALSLSL